MGTTVEHPRPAGADRASEVAASLGAQDVLVLHRVAPGEWLHVAGVGRPAGWAGTLHVLEPGAGGAPAPPGDPPGGPEPLLHRALAASGGVRVLSGTAERLVGPYWAATAVVLRTGPSELVVLGHPGRSEALLAASDQELRAAAPVLAAGGPGDGAASRLHEELVALQAAQTLTASLDQPLPGALERVADAFAVGLGASAVVVWLGDERCAATGEAAGAVGRALAAAARRLAPAPGAPARTGSHGLAEGAPPGPWLAVGLDLPGDGGVLAVLPGGHERPQLAPSPAPARAARVAAQLAVTASAVLQVALAREAVERQLDDTRLKLGRDALTDVGSRHRWDEELAAAQALVDAGVPVCVALLDLDDLKHVNDTHGHPAGDELLRTCAEAVRACLRGGSDVVARVGGDEFAVLVPRATDAASLTARLRAGVEEARTPRGLALRVSVGGALCVSGQRVAEAFAEADAAMYSDKRARRAARGRPARR